MSAKAACSGTWKRTTPAAFAVNVPASTVSPFPVAFQIARWNSVRGVSSPMLYSDVSSEIALSARPCVSRPTDVSSPLGPV